jgi:hypothetical protein
MAIHRHSPQRTLRTLEMMGNTVQEAVSLLNDLSMREPTVREKTAAGAFLAQFYGGIPQPTINKRLHFL